MSFEPIYVDMQVAESSENFDMQIGENVPVPFNWMGRNAKLIKTLTPFSVALKDTKFNTWTPSTTAKEILANADWESFEADLSQYDYTILIRFETDLKYVSGATLKVTPKFQVSDYYIQPAKRPSNITAYNSDVFNGNSAQTPVPCAPLIRYYAATGADAVAYTAVYGFYATAAIPTFSPSTGDPVTITVKRPSLNARCSNTYMSTARAAEIDKTNSLLKLSCRIYRADKGSMVQSMFNEVIARAHELDV